MGVPWGVEYADTEYEPLDFHLNRWKAFCAANLCRHFVIPIDGLFYEFKQVDDSRVNITKREDPELIAEINALSCGDGTYDMFEMITEGISLYVPDQREVRRIDRPEFEWGYESAGSLDLLCNLRAGKMRLAQELKKAAAFCKKHRLMLGISY